MGKTFNSILRGLTNGATTPTPEPKPVKLRPKSWLIKSMTEEQRSRYRGQAHAALREGLTVFMSKETVSQFSGLLGTEVNSRLMRRVLEEIGNGKLVLTAPGKQLSQIQAQPPSTLGGRGLPTVLSVDQLSAGIPFSLKQAAKILNVTANKLYFRCVTGRIHFERDRSRYYIPAQEVERLRVIGL